MDKLYQRILLAVLMVGSFASPGKTEPIWNAYVKVELVTNIKAIRPGHPFWVGLVMDMDDQWQTYWKNPGDSGKATAIEWQLPEGFSAGEIQWPYPKRMDYPELTSYGYEDKVVLMVQITPSKELSIGTTQSIIAKASWLSCGTMCVPGKADLSLELPVQEEEPAIDAPIVELFDATMRNWPMEKSQWTIGVYDEGNSFRLHLIPPDAETFTLTQAAFFPDRNDQIDHKAPQTFEAVNHSYELIVPKSAEGYKSATQLTGVLVSQEAWEKDRRAIAVNEPVNF